MNHVLTQSLTQTFEHVERKRYVNFNFHEMFWPLSFQGSNINSIIYMSLIIVFWQLVQGCKGY